MKVSQFHRTRMCISGEGCPRKLKCNYAHRPDELRENQSLSNTKLCRTYQQGKCKLKDEDCTFAHGLKQLVSTFGYFKSKRCAESETGCYKGAFCRNFHRRIEQVMALQLLSMMMPYSKTSVISHSDFVHYWYNKDPWSYNDFEAQNDFLLQLHNKGKSKYSERSHTSVNQDDKNKSLSLAAGNLEGLMASSNSHILGGGDQASYVLSSGINSLTPSGKNSVDGMLPPSMARLKAGISRPSLERPDSFNYLDLLNTYNSHGGGVQPFQSFNSFGQMGIKNLNVPTYPISNPDYNTLQPSPDYSSFHYMSRMGGGSDMIGGPTQRPHLAHLNRLFPPHEHQQQLNSPKSYNSPLVQEHLQQKPYLLQLSKSKSSNTSDKFTEVTEMG